MTDVYHITFNYFSYRPMCMITKCKLYENCRQLLSLNLEYTIDITYKRACDTPSMRSLVGPNSGQENIETIEMLAGQ